MTPQWKHVNTWETGKSRNGGMLRGRTFHYPQLCLSLGVVTHNLLICSEVSSFHTWYLKHIGYKKNTLWGLNTWWLTWNLVRLITCCWDWKSDFPRNDGFKGERFIAGGKHYWLQSGLFQVQHLLWSPRMIWGKCLCNDVIYSHYIKFARCF